MTSNDATPQIPTPSIADVYAVTNGGLDPQRLSRAIQELMDPEKRAATRKSAFDVYNAQRAEMLIGINVRSLDLAVSLLKHLTIEIADTHTTQSSVVQAFQAIALVIAQSYRSDCKNMSRQTMIYSQGEQQEAAAAVCKMMAAAISMGMPYPEFELQVVIPGGPTTGS